MHPRVINKNRIWQTALNQGLKLELVVHRDNTWTFGVAVPAGNLS